MQTVRTRIAPSPTGEPHIGGLRTALFNYLFAKKQGGSFILRIEDTDQARSQQKYIFSFIQSLKWAGIVPDEGPYIDEKCNLQEKGEYGPYIQSKRLPLYKKYAYELIGKNYAYYCFCDNERLEMMRKAQIEKKLPPIYDQLCEKLSKTEIEHKLSSGDSFVIRLRMPGTGATTFYDIIRGEISFQNNLIDHQILLKSDGFPTYHLANVVDDALMKITHVIRGEEWLSSTPKHVIIYQGLGFTLPQFAHLPLVLAEDRSKLSKRHRAVSIEDFEKQGYLPEALINFLALLGWSSDTGKEIFSLQELEKEFDIHRVQRSGAIFNFKKLLWVNKEYIKKLSPESLAEKIMPYIQKEIEQCGNEYIKGNQSIAIKKIGAIFQDRIEKISDISELSSFLFNDRLDYDSSLLIWKKIKEDPQKNEKTASLLEKALSLLAHIHTADRARFTSDHLRNMFQQLCSQESINSADILWPLRVAVSGAEKSPDVFDIIEILGLSSAKIRIQNAAEKLKNLL